MTGKSNNLEHSQLIDLLIQLKNSDDQIKIFYKIKIFYNKYLINNKIIDNHNLRNIIDSAVILSKQSDFIIQYIKEKNIEKTNDLVEFINEIIKLAYNFSEINEIQYKLIIEKIDNLYLTNGEIINEAKSNIIKNFSIHLNNMDKNIKETKEKKAING